jgi:hypothetical protein
LSGPYREQIDNSKKYSVYDEQKTPILIEFSSTLDDKVTRQTGILDLFKRGDLENRSEKALDKAMIVVHDMAKRISENITKLNEGPKNVEVEFGLKFDGEVGVIIAKASMEASVNIRLSWTR